MNKSKNKDERLFWITILGLVLVKCGYYAFRYYPVIDDWIQYGGYSLYENIFTDVILRIGTYTTRPLASLSDPYIWGKMWPNMWAAFLIITLLHFMSAWILYKVFKINRLPIGMSFLIIFLLLPLGTEATYWISASSRIVVGVFFMAVSLYFLSKYLNNDNKASRLNSKNADKIILILFWITHLISFGYYEQVIILSFMAAIFLIVANWFDLKHKLIIFIPFINLGLIGGYYKFFGNKGNMAQRGQVVDSDYIGHFKLVLDKITDVWGQAHLPLYSNGFKRGLSLLLENRSYRYILLVIIFSILAGIYAFKEESDKRIKTNSIKIFLGFILFWAPYGVNFLLKDVWISNRNAFTSFIGLGLVIDGIVNALNRNRIMNYVKGIGVSAVVLLFLIVNISELHDYKSISDIDRKISENVISSVQDEAFFEGNKKAMVFGTRPVYAEQNMYFHEHIHNITESDWAFTGGVRAVAKNTKIQYVKPVHKWSSIPLDQYDFEEYTILGIDNNLDVFPIRMQKSSHGDIDLLKSNGEYFGVLTKKEEGAYVLEIE